MIDINYEQLYGMLIFGMTFAFILLLVISVFLNRYRLKFYRLIVNEKTGKIEKTGLVFIFVLLILVYQATIVGKISTEIVYILCLAMGYDVGRKFLSMKNEQQNENTENNDVNTSSNDNIKLEQGQIDEMEYKISSKTKHKRNQNGSEKATMEDE